MSKLRVAIYSGVLPSTTFIERLIKGVSQRNVWIYLFGIKKKSKTSANPSVFQSTYSGNANKFWRLIIFTTLLFFFKHKDKKQLDQWIASRNGNSKLLKVKCYPVLWHKPDIFHLQWVKSIDDWIWVKDFGIKFIVSLRGRQINVEPLAAVQTASVYQKYFPKVDGFHAVSDAIAKEATKYGANPAKIKVVYSGLPDNQIPPNNHNTINHDELFKILSVGRSHWVKGYNYALAACYLLKEKGCRFHYTIVGAKDVEELVYQINDLALTDVVTLTENIPYHQVIQLMNNCHLFLLPSVNEGVANVVLEAMQLGKVVLTTNCGGMEEVVQDGINGFVVPVRDAVAMCDKLQEIQKLAKNRIDEIAENAQKTIRAMHTEEKMVNDMLALYHAVLQNTPIS